MEEAFIIDKFIFVFMMVPDVAKPSCLWNIFLAKQKTSPRKLISNLKSKVLIEYGRHLHGPNYKITEEFEELINTEHGDLVKKLIGKHPTYSSVVSDCLELLRTFQDSTNPEYLNQFMASHNKDDYTMIVIN